jgi:hypothetical protein
MSAEAKTIPSKRDQEQWVALWNAKRPPGTKVAVTLDSGEVRETKTRSAAEMLGGHTAVVWLDGIAGAYLLSRVMAIE